MIRKSEQSQTERIDLKPSEIPILPRVNIQNTMKINPNHTLSHESFENQENYRNDEKNMFNYNFITPSSIREQRDNQIRVNQL